MHIFTRKGASGPLKKPEAPEKGRAGEININLELFWRAPAVPYALFIGVRLVSPPDGHCDRPLKATPHRNAGAIGPAPGRSALLLFGVAIPVYNKDRS